MSQVQLPKTKSQRARGRRPKSEGPAFCEQKLDQLLVHGETVVDDKGNEQHRFPSYRELAARFNVAHSLIGRFAKKRNCLARRRETQAHTQNMVKDRLAKLRSEHMSLDDTDLIRTVERYLLAFEEALLQGQISADNPVYFNQMVRLRTFLMSDTDPNTEMVNTLPSLEALQQRYQEARKAQSTA